MSLKGQVCFEREKNKNRFQKRIIGKKSGLTSKKLFGKAWFENVNKEKDGEIYESKQIDMFR